jgi:uncharacterized lipoprotein YmbA
MRRRGCVNWLATIAMAMAAGCSILSPRPDATKFYVLTATSTGAAAAPDATRRLVIGLGPVKLPAYLEHAEVITRVAPNRLDLSSTDRWAEPLDDNFRRVLAADLTTLIGTDQVLPFPWDLSTNVDYKIEVNVQRFERDSSGGAQLTASWIIRDGRSDRVLLTRPADFIESAGSGMESSAASLSADLNDLSKQLADAVIDLNQQRQTHVAN